MNIVTSEQMRKIDEATISGKLNTGLELMEKAGTGLLEKSLEILSGKASPKTAIFCGKGNNGGDGFVLARLLSQKGIKVECFLLEPKDLIKRDAKTNLDMLEKLDKPVKVNVLNDIYHHWKNIVLLLMQFLVPVFRALLSEYIKTQLI